MIVTEKSIQKIELEEGDTLYDLYSLIGGFDPDASVVITSGGTLVIG